MEEGEETGWAQLCLSDTEPNTHTAAVPDMGVNQSSLTSVDRTYERLFHGSSQASPSSAFTRLAKIELQLILQLLDRPSLLRVARCDRSMLRVVDTPIAWAHHTLRFGVWQRWFDHHLSARLLAHSPEITLAWRSESRGESDSLSSLVRVLSMWPRLSTMDLSACTWKKPQQWNRVLAQPTMRTLRTLRIDDPDSNPPNSTLNAESFELIAAMPKLTELTFSYAVQHAGTARAMIQSLQDRLTSVQVRQCKESAVLSALMQCPALTRLHLIEPRWNGLDFKACFLSSPVLLNLERLDLDRWFGPSDTWMCEHPVPAADFVAVFSAMTRLTHLGLHDVEECELMFPSIVHAPALKQLSITSRSEGQVQMFRKLCPVAPVLALLHDHPNLRVSVTLCSHKGPVYFGCFPDSEEFMDLHHSLVKIEQDSFGGRFTLQSK